MKVCNVIIISEPVGLVHGLMVFNEESCKIPLEEKNRKTVHFCIMKLSVFNSNLRWINTKVEKKNSGDMVEVGCD